MRILLTGLPGSGKTTLSKLIAKDYNLCLVSAGQMLRNYVSTNENEEVKQMLDTLNKGYLVDDELIAKLLKERLSSGDCTLGFVIDGYPRQLSQIKTYDPGFDTVFFIDVPVEVVRERLMKRGRSDDNPEGIAQRINIYQREMEGLHTYFKDHGNLFRIDGSKGIDDVYSQIKEHLG